MVNRWGNIENCDRVYFPGLQNPCRCHNKGFSTNNPKYREAFDKADAYGYEAIDAIKARETYDTEDWLIIITSDHGGIRLGHGGDSIQERMTFVALNKEFK